MNQDREHLQLLAIFHYVVAGLAGLFSLFPRLYTTIGTISYSPQSTAQRNRVKTCRPNFSAGSLL